MAEDALASFRAYLEGFAGTLLRGYIAELSRDRRYHRRKEFNDPVWKTFMLQPIEVVVLDSPLLQRLRRIRQLGVAHWVYPGATHTRFEHSIGVVHQVQNLITSINVHSPREDEPFIDPSWTKLLRLTALCHDVGHGVMSHVSENALKNLSETEDVELAFADAEGIESAKLSEIAAYYLLGSPAFRELLETAQRATAEYGLPLDCVALMRQAIVGRSIRDDFPLLQELISGPFDADKLDYMPRDAQLSGIPVVTDVDRLVQKVRALRLAPEKLPPEVAKRVRGGLATYTLTGLALSGARTLDELMLGRTLLYDKIYRHQKVRAAEVMVASLLLCIAQLVETSPLHIPYRFSDDALLDLDRESLTRLASQSLSTEQEQFVDVAVDLAARLRDRHLFARAFAFATTMPLDPYRHAEEQRLGLERLLRDVRAADDRGKLVGRISEEMRAILAAINAQDVLASIPHSQLKSYIWLDPPSVPDTSADAARAYLIAENGDVMQFRDDFAETRSWADAYPLTRDVGYIFAPKELGPYLFLASEKILRMGYGIRFPRAMLDYAKQEPEQVDDLRRQLDQVGYYVGAPTDLRPLPTRLSRADIDPILTSIRSDLSGYGGLGTATELGKGMLTSTRLVDWLRQFERDDLIDATICVLKHVVLLGRDAVVQAVHAFVTEHPAFRGASVCPLGGPKDSSSITTYYTGDLSGAYDLRIQSLEGALAGDTPVIFTDDIIGSGGQAIDIFETWLGEPRTGTLHEERDALSEHLQSRLRGRQIALVVAAGLPDGVARVRERLTALGLNATIRADQHQLPRAFGSSIFSSAAQEEQFKRRCGEIGRALLLDGAPEHDEAWVAQRALGYGNDALLVIFPYNTPTQSLTCLWKAGKVDGVSWMPLFPRRAKN